MSKLAALVPPPRLNLTRFYGVFAPNSHVRAEVTASQRGKNSPRLAEHLVDSDNPYHARSMSWSPGHRRNARSRRVKACIQHRYHAMRGV